MTSDIIRARKRLIMYRGAYFLAIETHQHTANTHPNHYHKQHAENKIKNAREEYLERLAFYTELTMPNLIDDLANL